MRRRASPATDRYKAYNWLDARRRQICWAHLARDFQAMAGRGGAAQEIGEALLGETKQLFRLWHRVRDGTLSRRKFRQAMLAVERNTRALLDAGSECAHAKTRGTCRQIRSLGDALWTFVRVGGVEPTNNQAERALRRAVMWRRTSFGTQSEAGSRFVERMLTVVTSLRQQRRDVLGYLTAACSSATHNDASICLLPTTHHQNI